MCKFDSATRPLFAAHGIYTRGKRGEVYFMHLQRAFEAAVNLHVQLLLLSEACEAKVDFQRPGTVPYPPLPQKWRTEPNGRRFSPEAKVFYVQFPRVVWKNPFEPETAEEGEDLRMMCEGKFILQEEYETDDPGEDDVGRTDPTEESSAQREAQARRQEEERQHGHEDDEDELHQTE